MKRLGTLALFVLLVTAAEAEKRAELVVPQRCIADLHFGRCETRSDGRMHCPETSFKALCVEVKK